jgi:hypothetical protein
LVFRQLIVEYGSNGIVEPLTMPSGTELSSTASFNASPDLVLPLNEILWSSGLRQTFREKPWKRVAAFDVGWQYAVDGGKGWKPGNEKNNVTGLACR